MIIRVIDSTGQGDYDLFFEAENPKDPDALMKKVDEIIATVKDANPNDFMAEELEKELAKIGVVSAVIQDAGEEW